MKKRASVSTRGFSLLEIMVAIAILGLALTIILSAQGGLVASNRSANNMGIATSLARCKHSELEEKMAKLGYPEIDAIETGVSCCESADVPGFTCDTRVERVLLPNPPSAGGGGDGGLNLTTVSGGLDAGIASPLGTVLNNPAGTGQLDLDGGLGAIGSSLQNQLAAPGGGGGAGGLLNMAFGIVYPVLKPMMEASIRRLTVTVHWKEGPLAREMTLLQYITNPQRGGLDADGGTGDGGLPNLGALGGLLGGAAGGLGGAAGGLGGAATTPGAH
jgi:general secretion pathway protein I